MKNIQKPMLSDEKWKAMQEAMASSTLPPVQGHSAAVRHSRALARNEKVFTQAGFSADDIVAYYARLREEQKERR